MNVKSNLQRVTDTIQQGTLLVVQLTTLTYDDFIHLLEEANVICDKMPRGNQDEQIRFITVKDMSNNLLWKILIRIECQKVRHSDGVILSTRIVNLKQFIFLQRELKTLTTLANPTTISTFFADTVTPLAGTEGGQMTPVPAASPAHSAGEGGEKEVAWHGGDCSTVKKGQEREECVICLERESNVILPCAHAYCETCIGQWIHVDKPHTGGGGGGSDAGSPRSHSPEGQSCPVCRGEVIRDSDAWLLMDPPDPDESREEMSQVLMQLVDRTGKLPAAGHRE